MPIQRLLRIVIFTAIICPHAGAEEIRHLHGTALVKAAPLSGGAIGHQFNLVAKNGQWQQILPWIIQDRAAEPESIFLPALPIPDQSQSCLVFWDTIIRTSSAEYWELIYTGELYLQEGTWHIRYYGIAVCHSNVL